MVSFLDGPLAKALHQGFKGKLPKGRLVTVRLDPNTLPDEYGVIKPIKTSHGFNGFKEDYNDYNRPSGVPITDVKICIMAQSLPSGVSPLKDDKVLLQGKWWQIRSARTDPATALWVCQSYESEAPKDVD